MAHLSLVRSNPGFQDSGGPTGSDLADVSGEEYHRLRLIQDEVAVPFPIKKEGELFNRAEGTIEASGKIARKATQTCLYEITQAPINFYNGNLTLDEIISRVRVFAGRAIEASKDVFGIPECRKSCILAALGKCPFVMEDLVMTEESFSELVGIQIRSKKPPTRSQPAGVLAFRFFSYRAFDVRPPGHHVDLDEKIKEDSAVGHVVAWWVKHRPKEVVPPMTSSHEQLRIDFQA